MGRQAVEASLALERLSLETEAGSQEASHRTAQLAGSYARNVTRATTTETELAEDCQCDESAALGSKLAKECPAEFECPITLDVMQDPVIAADGHSYERQALLEWFSSGNSTSPKTND